VLRVNLSLISNTIEASAYVLAIKMRHEKPHPQASSRSLMNQKSSIKYISSRLRHIQNFYGHDMKSTLNII
jgi:hypothetical protein